MSDPVTAPKTGADKPLTIAVLAICGLLIVISVIFIALPTRDRASNAKPKAVDKAAPAPAVVAAPAAPTEQPAGPGARPVPREPEPPYSTPATLAVPKGNMGDWFPPDSYPADARRKEQEGRVTVSVTIDPEGLPRRCWIASSSGSESLDEATCRLAVENGEFLPARDADGRPVWTVFTLRSVKWQIQDR